MWMWDNRDVSSITPTVEELREAGYIREAQLDLMRNKWRAYEEAFLAFS